jgi:hypothetical protein
MLLVEIESATAEGSNLPHPATLLDLGQKPTRVYDRKMTDPGPLCLELCTHIGRRDRCYFGEIVARCTKVHEHTQQRILFESFVHEWLDPATRTILKLPSPSHRLGKIYEIASG